MSKCLVTGGAGFIGSNITQTLLKEDHFVRVLDNFCSGKESNLAFTNGLGKTKFEFIKGDIRGPETCQKACQGMDYVFHQAALRSVPKSLEEPEAYNDVNINGTLRLLQAALNKRIKRFVFASSSSVYGETTHFPQIEEDPLFLISPYALSKLAGEYYCRIFSHIFGLETVCLRYFNVFGPRQALDDDYAVVIPKFIHCLLHNKQPPIFGTGKQSRDFTYIEDVVSANILAAKTPGLKHGIFNVASGRDKSVLELLKVLNKILHRNIKPILKPPRAGDVFKTHASIFKIKNVLHFSPQTSFEEGLKRTIQYFQSQTNP